MRLITVALVLCGTALPALAQDVGGARAASQKFTAAMSSGDAATAAAMFSDSAYVLPPGRGPVRGKAQIQTFLGNMTRIAQGLKYTSEDVLPIGDSGAREMGSFSFNLRGRQGGAPRPIDGKYLIIWEKTGAEWRIAADMWNRNGNGPGGQRRGGMNMPGGANPPGGTNPPGGANRPGGQGIDAGDGGMPPMDDAQ